MSQLDIFWHSHHKEKNILNILYSEFFLFHIFKANRPNPVADEVLKLFSNIR